MHAVVVHVTIDDADASLDRLRDEVVPRVKQAPGAITGYWTRGEDTGLSMVVFESEDDAKAIAERVPAIVPEGVTLKNVEVREVVANF